VGFARSGLLGGIKTGLGGARHGRSLMFEVSPYFVASIIDFHPQAPSMLLQSSSKANTT
jgi:hypothetical protein